LEVGTAEKKNENKDAKQCILPKSEIVFLEVGTAEKRN